MSTVPFLEFESFVDAVGDREVIILATDRHDATIDDSDVRRAVIDAISRATGLIRSLVDESKIEHETLEEWCKDIARYKLARTHAGRNDDMRQRYEDAIEQMKLISRRQIKLAEDDGSNRTFGDASLLSNPLNSWNKAF